MEDSDAAALRQRFGAKVDVEGPDPDAEAYFFVKRAADVDHQSFMVALLGLLGDPGRLVLHHRTGFAVVITTFAGANRLRASPLISTVGGIQFDPEQFASVVGTDPTG